MDSEAVEAAKTVGSARSSRVGWQGRSTRCRILLVSMWMVRRNTAGGIAVKGTYEQVPIAGQGALVYHGLASSSGDVFRHQHILQAKLGH